MIAYKHPGDVEIQEFNIKSTTESKWPRYEATNEETFSVLICNSFFLQPLSRAAQRMSR